jgi:hypothetical protein
LIAYPETGAYDKGQTKSVVTRVCGHNEKAMFAHALSTARWENLYLCDNVSDKVSLFTQILQKLFETHFPLKTVQRHSRDKPWVTDYFRLLIRQRQYALKSGNLGRYRELRNKVNRLSKTLEKTFYSKKVEHLRLSNCRDWWKHMKDILGLKSSSTKPLQSLAMTTSQGDMDNFVDKVNQFFHSVSSHLEPLSSDNRYLSLDCSVPDEYIVSVGDMEKRLLSLNTKKSSGPDGLPVWIFHDFAHVLAGPLASIANASLRDGQMPDQWKLSDTVPIPKVIPAKAIDTDLRPISITAVAAKAIEYFPIKFMRESVIECLDPNQFGGIHGSSTVMALLKMVNYIAKSTDDTSNTVRMLLCDFSKAFDLVDHNILINKFSSMGVHDSLIKWSANFLRNRSQQVKIGSHVSNIVKMKAGCPQGTLLGPLAFVTYINDLCPPGEIMTIKFVDDTTLLHSFGPDENGSSLQGVMEYLSQWAHDNKMRFNVGKTREMVFNFQRNKCDLPKLVIDGAEIEQVSEAKLLGVIIRSDLKWNSHISMIIKKANKRLHLLRLCKRAGIKSSDLVMIYTSLVRSVLEYCCAVWHTALPKYLHNDLERIQKRALLIIYPNTDYDRSLQISQLDTLYDRREAQCKNLFLSMSKADHKLHGLLPAVRPKTHDLRNTVPRPLFKTRTQRYFNSFVPYCVRHYQ